MVQAEFLTRIIGDPEDREAWAGLYKSLWPFVFAINYRLLRGQQDLAEDLSQEVFLRLQRYAPFHRFRDNPQGLKNYIAAVCRNCCRTYMRQVFARNEVALGDPDEDCPPRMVRESEFAEQVEVDELLRDILGGLEKTEDRKLLRLLAEGHSLAEIGEAMELSYTNVGVRVHRLRKKLKKALQ